VRQQSKYKLSSCVPSDVLHDGIDWEPSWQEIEFDKFHRAKAIYEKDWMIASMQRLAAIGLVIGEEKRISALVAEQDRITKWFEDQNVKESEVNKQFEERMHNELDGPYLRAQLAKLERAEKEIRSGLAEIERAELERRGVVRGKRR
jgi:hypothetical protein